MNQAIYRLIIGCVLILSLITCGCVEEPTPNAKNTLYVDSQGTKQYTSIQHAIDNAQENYTIYVYAGVYYENLFINKSIILKGEDRTKTIIDGNNTNDVIYVDDKGKLNITGFTIRNSGPNESPDYDAGIELKSNNNSIINTIFYNNTHGVYARSSNYNLFKNNIFDGNKKYGMYLYSGTYYARITDNIFLNNYCGLRIKGSRYNNVTRNVFSNNKQGMYLCCGAQLNIVYHNTFLNNSIWNADDLVGGNEWDNGYPSGGNYWDDYAGMDEYNGADQDIIGSDGIGDNPYNLTEDGTRKDTYPLMEPVINP